MHSNNAIAVGLSTFTPEWRAAATAANASRRKGVKVLDARGLHHSGFDVSRGKSGVGHHQQLDVARHPEKAQPTHRKLRAKDRPLVNDFIADAEFDARLAARFANAARVLRPGGTFYVWGGYANIANYPAPLALPGCTSARPSSGTSTRS